MIDDRRNFHRRATAVGRIVERIRQCEGAAAGDELARYGGISSAAATRILRNLAMHFLIRNVARGQWIATTLLRSSYPLIPCATK